MCGEREWRAGGEEECKAVVVVVVAVVVVKMNMSCKDALCMKNEV